MSRRGIVFGILYGARAFAFIHFAGERLTPDSGLYARGKASWSSPACALSGYLAGSTGVAMVGCIGAISLGYLVASRSCGLLRPSLLAFSPVGWYAIQPAADAVGAAAVIVATDHPFDRKRSLLAMGAVSAFHLEAALVILGAWVLGSRTTLRLDLAACLMGALAQWHPTFHFQMRYFLPGVALLAIGRRDFGEDQRMGCSARSRFAFRSRSDRIRLGNA